jgi:hypothetical protein
LILRLALVAALLATPVFADTFDGRYFWRGTDPLTGCDPEAYNEGSITIGEGQIAFIESNCTLTKPTALRDMPEGTLFDAVCFGEGETWTERMMVYKTYDGVAVISRAAARTYSRCQ